VSPAAAAVISAGALRNNLLTVRRRAPGAKILAVIKANAYGHGLVPVARILNDADGLAVARFSEAQQLRDAGIAGRIVVLGGFVDHDEIATAVRLNLDPVVHSESQIALLESFGAASGQLDFWIKVETGMGRLGMEPERVSSVIQRLRALTQQPGSVRLMTHLAGADLAGDPPTQAQLDCFDRLASAWSGDVSIANSAAILQWPDTVGPRAARSGAENWVRPGLMLYGVSPLAALSAEALGLRPVMAFETRLISVKPMQPGQRVGYGGAWAARRPSRVGVAAAGYADGYPWQLAAATTVLVNGVRAPVIGRVSMDMITLDLTDVPDAATGGRVLLWGEGLPVEEVAAGAGRIPYDLLAGTSERVARRIAD